MGRYQCHCRDQGGTVRDLTNLVQTLNWSGDSRQITRMLDGTLAISPELSGTLPELGDTLSLYADGALCFTGTLVKRSRGSMQSSLAITALDGGWRLAQNSGFYTFRSVSAKTAAQTLCRDFGIPVGSLAEGGGTYSRKFSGVSLDKILAVMYTFAGEDTGKRYLPRFTAAGLLEVVEKPETVSLTIAPRQNSMGVEISEDISKMSTQVAIYSDDGKLLRTVQGEAIAGLSLQHILTQRKGKDVGKEATAYLEDHGLEQQIKIDCLGDTRLITGNAVLLQENRSGAQGLCWIESDTHTFKNNQYLCRLTVNFRNLMNEQTGGSEVK